MSQNPVKTLFSAQCAEWDSYSSGCPPRLHTWAGFNNCLCDHLNKRRSDGEVMSPHYYRDRVRRGGRKRDESLSSLMFRIVPTC